VKYVQKHFWKEHYVHYKFSWVISSHGLCARTHMHTA